MAERKYKSVVVTGATLERLHKKPVATAEILRNGEIGQFYGDESKPYKDMKPNEKTTEALHAWLGKNKEKAMKVFKGVA